MITKEYITELKNRGNGDLGYLVEKQNDNKDFLDNLDKQIETILTEILF